MKRVYGRLLRRIDQSGVAELETIEWLHNNPDFWLASKVFQKIYPLKDYPYNCVDAGRISVHAMDLSVIYSLIVIIS